MTKILWRIYYSDGTRFDNTQGGPVDAPKRGVQCINVQHAEFGRRCLTQASWYIWSPTANAWLNQEDTAICMLRVVVEPWTVVLAGEYIDETDFTRIRQKAFGDPDFWPATQKKTGV